MLSGAAPSWADSANQIISFEDTTKTKGSINKPPVLTENNRLIYLGISAGLPYLIGLRGECVALKSKDGEPSFMATTDAGFTLGWFASILIEKRLGASRFYLGSGYNYTKIIFGVSGGDVALVVSEGLHSALFTLTLRTSYLKAASFAASVGMLYTPALEDHPVFPMIRISLIRSD